MTAPGLVANLGLSRTLGVRNTLGLLQDLGLSWTPAQLFGPSDVGLWYDFSDTLAMRQDSAGTTAVTTLGQPIGRILDKSGKGNYAIQSTPTSRPAWDARKNRLLATATLATQNVTTLATPYTLSFSGTGTVTLSGTSTAGPLVGTGVGDRVSLTFTPTAGTLTLTVSGTVTDAQLEFGSVATSYQRVTTATDYADVGVPRGALFDGSDDWLVTAANLNLSGTDEVTVIAGVDKRSDAATGVVIELTASASSFNGAFVVYNEGGSGKQGWGYNSRGTAQAVAQVVAGYPAPITNVLTGLGDISNDVCVLRLNGTEVASVTTDQGTGNYSSNLLYLGRRGGTTLPLNGRITQLIIIGRVLTTDELALVEGYVAQRSGVTL